MLQPVMGRPNEAIATRRSASLDRVAIALSGLCALDCLAAPIVIALFPLLAGSLMTGFVHTAMVLLVLSSSIMALGLGRHRHRDALVTALGATGLGLLIGSLVAPEDWHQGLALIASVLIVSAHTRNYLLCSEFARGGSAASGRCGTDHAGEGTRAPSEARRRVDAAPPRGSRSRCKACVSPGEANS